MVIAVLSLCVSIPTAHILFRNWNQNFYYKIDTFYQNYLLASISLLLIIFLVIIITLIKPIKLNLIDNLRYE